MLNMFEKGHENHWAVGHLCVEKMLKAIYIKNTKEVPVSKVHNLIKLAKDEKLDISDEMFDKLSAITLFNIQARYPDYKNKFYSLCTNEYTEKSINTIKEVILWLKLQIQK